MIQCKQIKGFCPSKDNFLFNVGILTLTAKLRMLYPFPVAFLTRDSFIQSFNKCSLSIPICQGYSSEQNQLYALMELYSTSRP